MNLHPDDSCATRQSLLERLKHLDDDGAWRDFFETYWELIYHVARKAGLNDAEAQEVVQDTVIVVARKIGELDTDPGRGSFKSWLLGQARWRIGDRFRARQRASRVFQEPPGPAGRAGGSHSDDTTGTEPLHRVADSSGDPLQALWEVEWEQRIVSRVMERVKALVGVRQFQIFDLHVRQGLSVTETARALEVTRAAVYMAKSRVGRVARREAARLKAEWR